MTLSAYKKRKEEENRTVYTLLRDDKDDGVFYILYGAERDQGPSGSGTVCRKFSGILANIRHFTDYVTSHSKESPENKMYFVVRKFRFDGTEYKEEMVCRLDWYGKLLRFLPFQLVPWLSCKDVALPFRTGDILRVHNMPLTEDFYVIYLYDEGQRGNKHIQMRIEDGAVVYDKVFRPEIMEQTVTCPDARMRRLSQSVKRNPTKWLQHLKMQGLTQRAVPM